MKVTAPLRKSNSLVYIRIHDGRDIDFKVSAGIYIDPAHFDPKVPGYKRTSAVPAEVRSKTNKDIKAMIALAEENYRTGCDAEWLRQLLDDYRNGRPVATSPLESEALPQEPRDLPFWDIAELYMEKKKEKSAITSIFRRMRRYEAWQEKMAGRKGFRLSVPDFGLTELENFLDYTSNEYLYYLKCPDFFKDFEIYHSTMRPSSKNSLYSTKSLFPRYNVSDYNKGVREVFKRVGINRIVTVLNPVTRKEEQRPLSEVATSHMARRTFVGILYKQVKDPNLISSMSGHANGSKAFARYRSIDDEMKKELIDMID